MEEGNGNDVMWMTVTSLLKLVDFVAPMEEGNDVKWRAVTNLLKLVDVV